MLPVVQVANRGNLTVVGNEGWANTTPQEELQGVVNQNIEGELQFWSAWGDDRQVY